jgi:N-methylhydantoinase A/oxoprolinase/acetone carboxylase beta subunit
VREAVRAFRDAGVGAVAVCFLYSSLDTAHEAAARYIVSEEFPQAFVCTSHEVTAEFREFERLSDGDRLVKAAGGSLLCTSRRSTASDTASQ